MAGFYPPEKLLNEDAKLSGVDRNKWYKLASDDSIAKAKAALEAQKLKVTVVSTGAEALEVLKNAAPKGSTVSTGGSTTLHDIGFIEYLKSGSHGWTNLHGKTHSEKDPVKGNEFRKQELTADYFFASAAALGEDGSIIVADASFNKVAGVAGASHVVLVISGQKLVANDQEAIKRVYEWAFPLESARARLAYGVPSSWLNNILLIRGTNPFAPAQRIEVVIVKEVLGF